MSPYNLMTAKGDRSVGLAGKRELEIQEWDIGHIFDNMSSFL